MTAAIRPRTRTLLSSFPFVIYFLFFVLSVEASAASLSGRVTDPDGRAVANAELILTGVAAVPLRARSDNEGRFVITGLDAGRYRITASAPGLVSDAVAIDITSAPASLDISMHVSAIAETLVVSAAQIDQPLSRIPDSVTVIPGSEIEAKQQFTLAAALRSVPGLTLQQNGGPGTVTSLFTRGGESDFTLVLVDGIRVNSFGGGFDFSLLPLGDVDQVEIVRGPQSAVFGADAIGGVVHLTTRQGGRPTASGQIEGGGQATLRALGATRGAVGSWSFGVSGERNQSDGFTGIAPATGETVSNDDWEQSLAQGHFEWTRSAMTAVRDAIRTHGRTALESAGGTWPAEVDDAMAAYWERQGL